MSAQIFDEHSWRYEALVDWPKRLANETPFYRHLFAEVKVQSVLDTACGTGHHAEMFHSWGLRVEGADISPGMIERCRTRLGESDRLRWAVRSFDQPSEPRGAFDVVLCVGNSLSLANDLETIRRAVQAMLDSVRPGGVCVIHLLNIWSLPDGPMVWQKTKRVQAEGHEHILLKGVRRSGAQAWVEVVDLASDSPGLERWSESTPFMGMEEPELAETLLTAGATVVETYGNYKGEPYDRASSTDLLLVSRK